MSGSPPPPVMDEMLVRGPPSAVSRMALEMEAVSPLLSASTMRNLRTDCSIVAPLVSMDDLGGEWCVDGVRLRFRVELDGLELWRVSWGWDGGSAMAAEGRLDVADRLSGGVVSAGWEPSSEASGSGLPRCFPRRSARAADDLERL